MDLEQNPGYSCTSPKDLFPSNPEIADQWRSDWYSPVCRPWFKEQGANQDHGIITKLYFDAFTEASKDDELIMTSCMPVFREGSNGDKSFYAAICNDQKPIGRMIQYFPVDE